MTQAQAGGRAVLATALGAAIIGLAPIGLRLSELGPMATAFWRFVFALPILALAVGVSGKALPRGKIGFLILAGAFFGIDIALWHLSLTLTTVLNATLLSNFTPIFAALGAWAFLKERIRPAFAVGAGLAVFGGAALALGRAQSGAGPGGGEHGLAGDLVGVFSAVWYAAYLVMLRQARASVGVRAAMLATTFGAMLACLAATLIMGESFWPQSWRGWAIVIGLGAIVHVLGQGLIAYGVGRLAMATSGVLLWIQPVVAALLAWALFGEGLGWLGIAGAALVLGGVWVVQRGRA